MLDLQNLNKGESVLMVIKRHWIVFVILGIYLAAAIFISASLFYVLGFGVIGLIFNIVFWMFFAVWFYIEWLNHELDLFIITDCRIIGVEQIGFLNRTVSEANLGQVQEVNSSSKGFFANILDYGNIMVQTAGTASNFDIQFAPEPVQTSRKVLNIVDEYRNTLIGKKTDDENKS